MASGLSVGVPGALAALKLAHDKYGKLPWAELFEPAIALARDGFPISPRLAKMLAEADPQSFAPDARAYFFDAQGRPWPVGYKLTNPALADTFETIARDGRQGLLSKATSPKTSPAPCRTIRASPASSPLRISRAIAPSSASRSACPIARIKVCGMGPSSSGGVAVAQVLGLVEPFDLGPAPLGARAAHLIAEAERLAFADRARYLADPDFVAVPVAGLARSDLSRRTPRLDRSRTRAARASPPARRRT